MVLGYILKSKEGEVSIIKIYLMKIWDLDYIIRRYLIRIWFDTLYIKHYLLVEDIKLIVLHTIDI